MLLKQFGSSSAAVYSSLIFVEFKYFYYSIVESGDPFTIIKK